MFKFVIFGERILDLPNCSPSLPFFSVWLDLGLKNFINLNMIFYLPSLRIIAKSHLRALLRPPLKALMICNLIFALIFWVQLPADLGAELGHSRPLVPTRGQVWSPSADPPPKATITLLLPLGSLSVVKALLLTPFTFKSAILAPLQCSPKPSPTEYLLSLQTRTIVKNPQIRLIHPIRHPHIIPTNSILGPIHNFGGPQQNFLILAIISFAATNES